jgi:hypothetical protein
LRFGNLGRRHLSGEIIAVSRRVRISVSCSQAVPHEGLDQVQGAALTVGKLDAEVELRDRFPLSGGFLLPLACFDEIPWNAVSVLIERTERELRPGVSLLGKRSPLTQGCCVVPTVIGIHASLIIRPCRSSETDDRQYKSDRESKRHGAIITH